MKKILAACAAIILGGFVLFVYSPDSSEPSVSNIADDEYVVFFNTSARLDEQSNQWQVPIHGWIYEPQDSASRKAVFTKILKEKYGLEASAETESNFASRLNLIIADNERAKSIVVEIAGRTVQLPASMENGHFEATLTFPAAEIEPYATDGIVSFSAVTGKHEKRPFTGEIRLIAPEGLSVISDIDDTIKVSNVTDHEKLLDYTFFRDFEAAPGMASLYRNWVTPDVSLHFVSSSPWQLYSPLVEFIADENFPWASLHLKAVRFRDETLFDLFKKGTETKPLVIKKILSEYPRRKFVLVGDSGEQDPEVYAGLILEHPEQIVKVYIRNVTNESADNERFTTVFDGIDTDCWSLFEDPSTLSLPE